MSMAPETVTMLRNYLWGNSDHFRPLPPVLCEMHEFEYTRLKKYALQNRLTPGALMTLVHLWKYQTEEGRVFFGVSEPIEAEEEEDETDAPSTVDWTLVPAGTKLMVEMDGARHEAVYRCARGRYQLAVEVNGQVQNVLKRCANIVAAS